MRRALSLRRAGPWTGNDEGTADDFLAFSPQGAEREVLRRGGRWRRRAGLGRGRERIGGRDRRNWRHSDRPFGAWSVHAGLARGLRRLRRSGRRRRVWRAHQEPARHGRRRARRRATRAATSGLVPPLWGLRPARGSLPGPSRALWHYWDAGVCVWRVASRGTIGDGGRRKPAFAWEGGRVGGRLSLPLPSSAFFPFFTILTPGKLDQSGTELRSYG